MIDFDRVKAPLTAREAERDGPLTRDVKTYSFVLIGHRGYRNRGCEAIVRSTSALLATVFPRIHLTVASFDQAADSSLPIAHVDDVIPAMTLARRYSAAWFKRVLLARVLRDEVSAYEVLYSRLLDRNRGRDAWFSVGGDNYCYGPPYWLYAMHRAIRRKHMPLVLWGASIEPAAIDRAMSEDLLRFDLIIARETLTYQALLDRHLAGRAHLHPDPAFTMQTEELSLPDGWRDGEMLGLNISPLAAKSERVPGMLVRSASRLVEHVLRTTRLSVALIPHVTLDGNDDSEPLKQIYRSYGATGRVLLIGNGYSAPQYKGFISRCRLFVGARTHATIAAYSSAVPTLAIGYSIKSRGIARDLLGDEELVIPVQALENEQQLVMKFEHLREAENDVRATLGRVLPDFRRRSAAAAERVRAVVA